MLPEPVYTVQPSMQLPGHFFVSGAHAAVLAPSDELSRGFIVPYEQQAKSLAFILNKGLEAENELDELRSCLTKVLKLR